MLSTVLGTENINTKQDIAPNLQLTDIIAPTHKKNLNAMTEEALVVLLEIIHAPKIGSGGHLTQPVSSSRTLLHSPAGLLVLPLSHFILCEETNYS